MKYIHYYEYNDSLHEWDKGTNLVEMKAEADRWANPQYKNDKTFMRQIIKDSTGKVVYDVGPGSEDIKLKALNDKIKVDNAAFNKLPKYKQRIAIAKDVLQWLKVNKLIPHQQRYFDYKLNKGESIETLDKMENKNGDIPLQEVLLNKVESCNVCAKGAIFACTVARRNEVTVNDADNIEFANGAELSDMLGGVFSAAQLRLIETEFEQQDIEYMNGKDDGDHTIREIKPKMDIKRFNAKNRMIKIMENIIKNKGWFKP